MFFGAIERYSGQDSHQDQHEIEYDTDTRITARGIAFWLGRNLMATGARTGAGTWTGATDARLHS